MLSRRLLPKEPKVVTMALTSSDGGCAVEDQAGGESIESGEVAAADAGAE